MRASCSARFPVRHSANSSVATAQRSTCSRLTRPSAQVIDEYLGQYTKALDRSREFRLVEAPQAANPLYLRSLLEELRVVASHSALDALIAH
jgi:hypothetical protein